MTTGKPSTRPLPRRGRAFGFVELLTAIAFLVIVLGVVVSLARYVRATSAEQLTRQLLGRLESRLSVAPPEATDAFEEELPAAGADEAAWAAYALKSNAVVQRLAGTNETVNDAWGSPIGFLSVKNPSVGMAPRDRPFCFSAGPDGRYLTQDDNLYSYEELSALQTVATPGGHREQ